MITSRAKVARPAIPDTFHRMPMSRSRLISFVRLVSACVFCAVGLAQPSAHARIDIPDAAQPQLARDSQGRVWLAYGRTSAKAAAVAHNDGGHAKAGGHGHGAAARPDGEIFVARSDDGGATFTVSTKVANVPNLMLGNRRGPRIAVAGDQVTLTVMSREL